MDFWIFVNTGEATFIYYISLLTCWRTKVMTSLCMLKQLSSEPGQQCPLVEVCTNSQPLGSKHPDEALLSHRQLQRLQRPELWERQPQMERGPPAASCRVNTLTSASGEMSSDWAQLWARWSGGGLERERRPGKNPNEGKFNDTGSSRAAVPVRGARKLRESRDRFDWSDRVCAASRRSSWWRPDGRPLRILGGTTLLHSIE